MLAFSGYAHRSGKSRPWLESAPRFGVAMLSDHRAPRQQHQTAEHLALRVAVPDQMLETVGRIFSSRNAPSESARPEPEESGHRNKEQRKQRGDEIRDADDLDRDG